MQYILPCNFDVRAVGSAASLVRRAAGGDLVVPEYLAFCQEVDQIFLQVLTALMARLTAAGGRRPALDAQPAVAQRVAVAGRGACMRHAAECR